MKKHMHKWKEIGRNAGWIDPKYKDFNLMYQKEAKKAMRKAKKKMAEKQKFIQKVEENRKRLSTAITQVEI